MSSIIKQENVSHQKSRRILELKQMLGSQQHSYDQEETISVIDPSELIEAARKEAQISREQIKKEYEAHQIDMSQEKESFHKQCIAEREAAFQKGYQEGFEVGKKDAHESYASHIEQARQIIQLSEQDYNLYLESAEADILSLSIEIARTILNDTIQEDHEKWLAFVKKAVAEARDQETITVTVDPSWFETTCHFKKDLENVTYGARLVIYPNEKLPTNSCLIETPYGQIDASLDSQLNEMKNKLSELLQQGYDVNERN